MKRFCLIGAAGYIAPRHMKAIAETGNDLVAAMDRSDSVGILDSNFPNAQFFTEFEQFEAFVDQQRRIGNPIDYISIASPNYLHDAHMRFAMRSGADAICEKPIVLWPEELEALIDTQVASGQQVNTILQLRLHPSIIALREKIQQAGSDRKYDVDLAYVTSRGNWYLKSWKSDESKAGGIATNIGVHMFDMLHFIFGDLQENRVHLAEPTKAAGYLEYVNARVRWFLSLDVMDVPAPLRVAGQRTYRSITVDGEELEFSDGFTDLHTRSYEEVLAGNGFGLAENRTAIATVATIRTASVEAGGSKAHPLVDR